MNYGLTIEGFYGGMKFLIQNYFLFFLQKSPFEFLRDFVDVLGFIVFVDHIRVLMIVDIISRRESMRSWRTRTVRVFV